jgi:hypothetical protein
MISLLTTGVFRLLSTAHSHALRQLRFPGLRSIWLRSRNCRLETVAIGEILCVVSYRKPFIEHDLSPGLRPSRIKRRCLVMSTEMLTCWHLLADWRRKIDPWSVPRTKITVVSKTGISPNLRDHSALSPRPAGVFDPRHAEMFHIQPAISMG